MASALFVLINYLDMVTDMELLDILVEIREKQKLCTDATPCWECEKHRTSPDYVYCHKTLEYLANELKKRGVDAPPEWTPISKEKPPERDDVLLCDVHGHIGAGYWMDEGGTTIWYTSLREPIVAWRPAPQVPIFAEDLLKAAVDEALGRFDY